MFFEELGAKNSSIETIEIQLFHGTMKVKILSIFFISYSLSFSLTMSIINGYNGYVCSSNSIQALLGTVKSIPTLIHSLLTVLFIDHWVYNLIPLRLQDVSYKDLSYCLIFRIWVLIIIFQEYGNTQHEKQKQQFLQELGKLSKSIKKK